MNRQLLGLGALGAGLIGLFASRWRTSLTGRVVIVTGGSRGLGLELARELARRGAIPAIVARDEAELARARDELRRISPRVDAISCDVTDRVAVHEAVAQVMRQHGRVDALINNAGVIQVGPFDCMDRGDFLAALEVHVMGALHFVEAVVPLMRERGGGRIVNVASIGGLVAIPHMLPYVTSKFALVGMSRALRAELARDGVLVTTVCPGLMRTGSHVQAEFKGDHDAEFLWFALGAAMPGLAMASRAAARRIVDAMQRGAPELTLSVPAKLLGAVGALAPGLLARALSLVNRALPTAERSPDAHAAHKGAESRARMGEMRVFQSIDEAARRNNEVAGEPAHAA